MQGAREGRGQPDLPHAQHGGRLQGERLCGLALPGPVRGHAGAVRWVRRGEADALRHEERLHCRDKGMGFYSAEN